MTHHQLNSPNNHSAKNNLFQEVGPGGFKNHSESVPIEKGLDGELLFKNPRTDKWQDLNSKASVTEGMEILNRSPTSLIGRIFHRLRDVGAQINQTEVQAEKVRLATEIVEALQYKNT